MNKFRTMDAGEALKFIRRLFPGVRFVFHMVDYSNLCQLAWERDGRRNAVQWHASALVRPQDIAKKVLSHAYPGTVIRG